ncbi:hypothetical protein Rs2_51342 [Raphanus sativus]|nr:hypothetical protein Rs2_51342 [Raphanus sativus]
MGQVSESALCFWSWLVRSAASVGGLTALRELRCWSSSDCPVSSKPLLAGSCAAPHDHRKILTVQLILVVEVEALRLLGVRGFALLLEEVVRLGSGDAAPSLHRLRGRARLSKLSAIKLLWLVLSCLSSDLGLDRVPARTLRAVLERACVCS